MGNWSNWNQLKQIEIKTELVPIETNLVQWGPMDFYRPIYPLDHMDQLKPIETNWSPILSYRAWVNLSNWDPLGPIKTNGVPSSLSEPIGPIGWCQLVQMLLHLDLSNWNLFRPVETNWNQLKIQLVSIGFSSWEAN